MRKVIRQHEPLRVPSGWEGQSRALVIQLESILDNIFSLITDIQTTLKDLDARVKALEDENEE